MLTLTVKALREWLEPKTITEARSLHCLSPFYKRFIRHFISIMASNTKCLNKGSFQWTSKATLAFRNNNEWMASTLVLKHPNFSKVFEFCCDASKYGIGGVLSQEGHPIAFFSEKLSESRHIKCTTYEKELYTLLQSLCHWRYYLLPYEFVVYLAMKPLSTRALNLMLILSMLGGSSILVSIALYFSTNSKLRKRRLMLLVELGTFYR